MNFKYLILFFIPMLAKAQTWQVSDTIINNEKYFVYPKNIKNYCCEPVDLWLVNDTFYPYIPRDGKWIQFYAEDINKIAKKFEIEDSILNGKWTEYYYNQSIHRTGSYCAGNRCGEWIEYNDSGHLISTSYFKSGIEDGLSKTYYDNGQLESIGYFKDNRPDSIWQYYYANGSLKYRLTYEDGTLLTDTIITYHDNGKLKSIGKINDKLFVGFWRYYYPNSKIAYEGNYYIAQMNVCAGGMAGISYYSLKTGKWMVYYDTGEILAILDFKIIKRIRPGKTNIHSFLIDKSKLRKLRYYDKRGKRVSKKYIIKNKLFELDTIKNGKNYLHYSN